MKILGHNISKKVPLMLLPALFIPIKTSKNDCMSAEVNLPAYTYFSAKKYNKNVTILNGLETRRDTNFVGGISHRFTEESVQKLKNRISRPKSFITYQSPIEINKNTYTEPFGYFFASRPSEDGNFRPHLGLDIFTTPLAVKPKKPVKVFAPIDGVIISSKKANENDNIVANAVTLLGVDGRRYSFDHLARPTDYDTFIELPKLGKVMRAGDEIGYVGATGETVMWHLHLVVATDEQLEKQNKSELWQKLANYSGYCKLSGQVNPLDKDEAGPIAEILSKINGAGLYSIGNFDVNLFMKNSY